MISDEYVASQLVWGYLVFSSLGKLKLFCVPAYPCVLSALCLCNRMRDETFLVRGDAMNVSFVNLGMENV